MCQRLLFVNGYGYVREGSFLLDLVEFKSPLETFSRLLRFYDALISDIDLSTRAGRYG